MALMTERERTFAGAISRLGYCNPFLPERIEAERDALGPRFVASTPVWHARAVSDQVNPNHAPLAERVTAVTETLRARLEAGRAPVGDERGLYEDVALSLLFMT